jgi:hypothetical protein
MLWNICTTYGVFVPSGIFVLFVPTQYTGAATLGGERERDYSYQLGYAFDFRCLGGRGRWVGVVRDSFPRFGGRGGKKVILAPVEETFYVWFYSLVE